MNSGVEPLFPLASGIILLLASTAGLLASPVSVAFTVAGVLFFAAGLVFGRPAGGFPWGAGTAILAPFLLLSAFLVSTYGIRWILLPALAAGGVASGFALRRTTVPRARGVLLGALWVCFVAVAAFWIVPGIFDRVSFTGFVPR